MLLIRISSFHFIVLSGSANHIFLRDSMSSFSPSSLMPSHAPIRTVLVDDSPGIRENVKRYLTRHFEGRIVVVGEGKDVNDSVRIIRQLRPNLLLLDIELMTGTGFDILDTLTDEERSQFTVVMITQFDNYVKQAMQYGVVDYVDKPILTKPFIRGIERGIKKVLERQALEKQVREELRTRIAANPTADILSLLELREQSQPSPEKQSSQELPAMTERPAHIQVRHTGAQTQEVPVREITHCLASGSYTFIHRQTGQPIMDSHPLKRYEEKLLEHGFLRISRSLVVNPQLCRVLREGRNDVTVILPDGTAYYVEGTYKEKAIAFLQSQKR